METIYKVHPAIAVMRVGSGEGFFLQGERIEDGPFELDGDGRESTFQGYKDPAKRIRRQAARFRIFEYRRGDEGRDELVREITSEIARIEWRVDLAASKAAGPRMGATFLPSGLRAIIPMAGWRNQPPAGYSRTDMEARLRLDVSGVNQRPGPPPPPSIVGRPLNIAEVLTDSDGRLVVLAGPGGADSWGTPPPTIDDYLNNPTWYDDIADGPVDAVLFFPDGNGGEQLGVPVHEGAWVASAPPDFAPDLLPVVSQEDIAFDAWRRSGGTDLPDPLTYVDDVEPMLQRAALLRWTHDASAWADIAAMLDTQNDLSDPAGSGQARQDLVDLLRQGIGSLKDLALTNTQDLILERYVAGAFVTGPDGRTEDAGRTLDRSVLGRLIGGGFFPGIEVGFTSTLKELWSGMGRLTRGDFIDHDGQARRLIPGMLTQRMACPWQADFCECREQWWPAQRPDKVRFTEDGQPADLGWERGVVTDDGESHQEHVDMIAHFAKLGVIERRTQGGQDAFVEIGRGNI